MANFCSNCGAPLTGSFCGQCGARQGAAPSAPAQPVMASAPPPAAVAPAPAPAKGGGALKIVLIVLGVLVLIGALGIGGIVYVGYRVKQKITQVKNEIVETANVSQPGGFAAPGAAGRAGVTTGCTVLPADEAGQVLGVTIVRAEMMRDAESADHCAFYLDPAARQQLAQQQMSDAMKQAKSSGDQTTDAQKVGADLIGALQNAVGNQASSNTPDFKVEVKRSGGKDSWPAIEIMQMGMKAQAGIGMEELQGLADKAVIAPLGRGLYLLKGDTLVSLTFERFAPGQDKLVGLGKKVLARL